MNRRLFDAHNHLHDARLAPYRAEILQRLPAAGVVQMVVNGTREADWPEVLALAQSVPQVLPSFGYHPWHVGQRTPDWQAKLVQFLDAVPAAVGEIGLDKWIPHHNLAEQREVFVWQLRLAAARNLPVSIHCLEVWGALLEILRSEPRPRCGFVLHSYAGPCELVGELVGLGGYFSLPGSFAHERKARQRATFKEVPRDRLLLETDAPDQALPEARVEFSLPNAPDGKRVNHPGNLGAVYRFAAELRGETVESLAQQAEENFRRVFGTVGANPGKL